MNVSLKELKVKDYEKYLAVLLVPKSKQNAISALFLFHHEISQIPVEVSEPMIGMIKLQWWQDVLNEIINGQPPRPHPILKSLVSNQTNYPELIKIIENYHLLLDGQQPTTIIEVEQFLLNTECAIIKLAAEIVGSDYNEQIILAYCCSIAARKLLLNSKTNKQMHSLAEQLIEKSQQILPQSNCVWAVISKHYNKYPLSPRWRLLLKLITKPTYF